MLLWPTSDSCLFNLFEHSQLGRPTQKQRARSIWTHSPRSGRGGKGCAQGRIPTFVRGQCSHSYETKDSSRPFFSFNEKSGIREQRTPQREGTRPVGRRAFACMGLSTWSRGIQAVLHFNPRVAIGSRPPPHAHSIPSRTGGPRIIIALLRSTCGKSSSIYHTLYIYRPQQPQARPASLPPSGSAAAAPAGAHRLYGAGAMAMDARTAGKLIATG